MKSLLAIAVSALMLSQLAISAEPAAARQSRNERSLDLRRQMARQLQRAPLATNSMITATTTTPPPVTLEQVGDVDSFGRYVKYLGVVTTSSVSLFEDCGGFDTSFGDRCVTLQAAPAVTLFNEPDLGRIELPARASRSLLCFNLVPFTSIDYFNPLPTSGTALFQVSSVITVENPVLNDPALLDPDTGLPYGGRLAVRFNTYFEQRSIGAGEFQQRDLQPAARTCLGGLVSKQSLRDSGLTEAQASQFFSSKTTLRMGASGSVSSSNFATYFYGLRVFGD